MLLMLLFRIQIHHNVADHCGYIRQTAIADVSCSQFGKVRLKFCQLHFGELLGTESFNL